jgi:sodium-dependent dicarboxylate transporter 2/3/5
MADPARAAEVIEAISEGEQRLDRARRGLGLVVGPLVLVAGLALPLPGLAPDAARLVPVLLFTLIWWITEAVPIPVTALLGPALAVVCGVGTPAEMFAAFGDPIVLFFLGSFVLAEAMAATGLDRRLAYAILTRPAVAASPARILVGFALLTAVLSGWMNNTATTAMLFPIGMSVLAALARGTTPSRLRYATALMLTLAYASSIGGIATPVGTAPNLIALGQLGELAGVQIPFLYWMVIAAPIAAVMLALWLLYARWALPPDVAAPSAWRGELAAARAAQGPLSRGQRNALLAFALTVTGWLLPGLVALALGAQSPTARALDRLLPESVVAVLGAGLLFVLPVDWQARRFTLSWSEAVRIDWGTLLLFGGGLALGGAMFRTGLAEALGQGLVAWTGSDSVVSLTFLFAFVSVVLTETTSNTASTTMVAPLAIAAAQAAGVSPIPPTVAVALAASMAFMLPVSTPPNAIVYGSGCVPITSMLRHGALLDLASVLVVPAGVLAACRLLGLG